jgi:hypothetical protein
MSRLHLALILCTALFALPAAVVFWLTRRPDPDQYMSGWDRDTAPGEMPAKGRG